jgi:hypothetical protein
MEMTINLSNEMIEKITSVSAWRTRDLHHEIKKANDMDAVTDREKVKKRILLKDLNKYLEDAEEVYDLFFELLQQIDLAR